MSLATAQILQNRYQIIRPLGTGEMGDVYLAEDMRLGNRLCAVKESRLDFQLSPTDQAQFHRQFQIESRSFTVDRIRTAAGNGRGAGGSFRDGAGDAGLTGSLGRGLVADDRYEIS
jgi:hypothetical protein